jgi:GT2 family glycosyltransferase
VTVDKNLPLVSAIVANWNGEQDLRACLPSLRRQTYSNLEIFVVDGGSVDASEVVARNWHAQWVPLNENRGLAAALNEGARVASGEFLLFLNNDMRFAVDFVEELAAALRERPEAFGADAHQYDWEGSESVHACSTFRKTRWPKGEVPGWELAQCAANEVTECVMGSAANLMVRRSLFDELRGWDERYPVGWEDIDLSWRAWLRGWQLVYVPKAICWHRVGGSTESSEGARARLKGTLQGRLLFATKLLPWTSATTTWAVLLGGLLAAGLRGSRDEVRDRITAFAHTIPSLPKLFEERIASFETVGKRPRAQLAVLLEIDSRLGQDAAVTLPCDQ